MVMMLVTCSVAFYLFYQFACINEICEEENKKQKRFCYTVFVRQKNDSVYRLKFYSDYPHYQLEDFWDRLYNSSKKALIFSQKGKRVICLRENILETTMTKEQVNQESSWVSNQKKLWVTACSKISSIGKKGR